MIFLELVLENIGLYQGRQVINLCPGESQPIVLIGGMNGAGKTTLLDAIRLALYGHRSPCSTRGNRGYADFLRQCIHRQAESATLELVIQHTLPYDPQPTEVRICRTWTQQVSQRDTLKVLVNGNTAPDLTQTWDERIEDLFPLGISHLFLFDGEQVSALAEQDTLPPSVTQAIQVLLGLELSDRLAADLDVLSARKRKDLATAQDQAQLAAIEHRLDSQEQQRRTLVSNKAAIQQKLDQAEEKLRLSQERFLTEGGKIAAEQTQQELQLEQAKQTTDAHRASLRDVAAGVLPLALIQPLLQQAAQQIQQDIRQQQLTVAQELLQERSQNLLTFLDSLDLTAAHRQQIQAFLAAQETELAQDREQPWLGADVDTLHHLTSTLDYALPHQRQVAEALLAQIQTCQAQIETIERYLATAATPEAYAKLEHQVQQTRAQVATLSADREQIQRQLAQAEQTLLRTKQELLDYGKQAMERQNTEHILTAIAKVQSTLTVFKQKLTQRKLHALETQVTNCYQCLLHKSDFVQQVHIDPETFSLSLVDSANEPIAKHRLSAGEKQLLAIALLWGLAQASGRELPIAIDTPLGRLDSAHRHNLLDRYFPHASHQVLLLSTDAEIGEADVHRLRASGAIAREYLLQYDSALQQTKVELGYFQ